MKKLTDNQYRELIQTYREGNSLALGKILKASDWLVRKVASKYRGEELTVAGEEGLKKAVKKFDLSKPYKFLTYATWWIRAGIHRYLGLPVE